MLLFNVCGVMSIAVFFLWPYTSPCRERCVQGEGVSTPVASPDPDECPSMFADYDVEGWCCRLSSLSSCRGCWEDEKEEKEKERKKESVSFIWKKRERVFYMKKRQGTKNVINGWDWLAVFASRCFHIAKARDKRQIEATCPLSPSPYTHTHTHTTTHSNRQPKQQAATACPPTTTTTTSTLERHLCPPPSTLERQSCLLPSTGSLPPQAV
jgi:hypothetical protein